MTYPWPTRELVRAAEGLVQLHWPGAARARSNVFTSVDSDTSDPAPILEQSDVSCIPAHGWVCSPAGSSDGSIG